MGWDLTPALSLERRGRSVGGRNGWFSETGNLCHQQTICPLLGKEREVCGWSKWLVFRDGKSVPSTNNLSPLLGKERARVRF
jgi:hypothetical protein